MGNRQLTKEHLLCSLIALMAFASTDAQTASPVPRLVVNIVIDQLRTDYMEAFSPLYGHQGFRRLMEKGRVYTQAEYPFTNVDRASALASLATGATPYDNGIIAEKWLDRATLRPVYCVDDATVKGLNTKEGSSTKNLGSSTLGDELKVATEGKGLVYSIAPYRDAAVLAAGHDADGAFWLNDDTGQWSGSSYYGENPQWLSSYEKSQSLAQRLSDMVWEPANNIVGHYNYFVSGGTRSPFKHKFEGDNRFRSFKTSAYVNSEVNRLVRQCLTNTKLGADGITDLLSVVYYAGNFEHRTFTECPLEIQDTYVRLDGELANIMATIESRVGADNVLFVVTSTGYADEETADLKKYRIPTGDFHINKTAALLNLYLMAIYGDGQYVETCFGSQIYLDHKLIEKKQLNLSDVLDRAQEFLIQVSGIKDVYTSKRLTLGAWTPGISRIRNSYNPKCSGDIYVQVAPGWHLVNEDVNENRLMRESYIGFPIIFFGSGVKTETIQTPVSVDCIAPTLAGCMRIRAPNACTSAPLPDFR